MHLFAMNVVNQYKNEINCIYDIGVTQMYCIKCGNEIVGEMKFCPKCGSKLPYINKNEETNNFDGKADKPVKIAPKIDNNSEKKSNPITVILSSVIPLAMVILLIMAFMGKFDKAAHDFTNGAFGNGGNIESNELIDSVESDIVSEVKDDIEVSEEIVKEDDEDIRKDGYVEESGTTKTSEEIEQEYATEGIVKDFCGTWKELGSGDPMYIHNDGDVLIVQIPRQVKVGDYAEMYISGRLYYDFYRNAWTLKYEDGIFKVLEDGVLVSEDREYKGTLIFTDESFCSWYNPTGGTEIGYTR